MNVYDRDIYTFEDFILGDADGAHLGSCVKLWETKADVGARTARSPPPARRE